MKKVIEKGKLSKSTSEIKTEKTPVPPPETPGISQVVGGENQNFNPETKSTSPQKPYIFDVKLQERKPEEESKILLPLNSPYHIKNINLKRNLLVKLNYVLRNSTIY